MSRNNLTHVGAREAGTWVEEPRPSLNVYIAECLVRDKLVLEGRESDVPQRGLGLGDFSHASLRESPFGKVH